MVGLTSLIAVVADWNEHHMGRGSWMWLAGTFIMFFMIAGVGLIVWLVTRKPGHQSRSGLENARAILADRMARGEITPDEYRDRLGHLQ
ncbi:MAG: SHOCT domain-containing protein [Acidimicrobiia bacterium]